MLTIKKVNKNIQKMYPFLELVKGEGYFYFICLDDKEYDLFGLLDCTSVYAYTLNQMDLSAWIDEAKNIVSKMNKLGECNVN